MELVVRDLGPNNHSEHGRGGQEPAVLFSPESNKLQEAAAPTWFIILKKERNRGVEKRKRGKKKKI